MDYILFTIGLGLLIGSADRLVDAASGLARRLGVSALTTAVVVVGFGTSMPELLTSLDAALHRPAPDGLNTRAYSHRLGESGVSFFADAATAKRLRRRFPRTLAGAPLLLPTTNTVLRRSIDAWMEEQDLVPSVVAEFEDSALLKAFGQVGGRVFPGPTAMEKEIRKQYRASVVGRAAGIKEVFYAISPERRLKHPAATAISEAARTALFATV